MKTTTSISINTEVLNKAKAWARDERRNFSGHLEVLLESAIRARRSATTAGPKRALRGHNRTRTRKEKEVA